jgi:hypothetical protein
MTDDDFIDDEDLLIEAAKYAVKQGVSRNAFMSRAKKAWFEADTYRRGVDRQRSKTRQASK